MTDQTCPCHAEPEYPATLVAEENDAVDAIEAAHVAMVRAGINVANSRAYIRSIEQEVDDAIAELTVAMSEQDDFEAIFDKAFAAYQSLRAGGALDHPEDETRL
jgi:hypothetical protein